MVLFRVLVVITIWMMFCIPSFNAMCVGTWTVEPNTLAESNNCDATLGQVNSVCSAVAPSDFNVSIQWYYSGSEQNAGVNGSIVLNSIQNSTISSGNEIRSSSILQIGPQDISEGYYWCQVEIHSTNRTAAQILNPSKILKLAKPCNAIANGPCENRNAFATSSRCAYGEIVENITVVDIQSITSCDEEKDELTTTSNDESERYLTTTEKNTSETTEDSTVDDTTENKMKATEDSSTTGGDTSIEKEGSTVRDVSGATTDGVDTSTVTLDSSTVGSTTTATDSGGTVTDVSTIGNVAGGLGNSVIWIIIGLGVAVLLMAIAMLLVIIVCLKCSKKKVKDNSGIPNQFVNQAYMTGEFELSQSLANSQDNKVTEVNTALDRNHIYSEIPPNFTIADVSGDNSPNQLTASNNLNSFQHSLPGQYEDVDPIETREGQNDRHVRHEYESVVNGAGGRENYNRLQISGSKSHLSASLSRPSISPICPPDGNPSPLFDSPEYSQLNQRPHVDIYRSSSNGSNSETHEVLIPKQTFAPYDSEVGHTYQVLEDPRSGAEVVGNRRSPLVPPHDSEVGHTYQILEDPRSGAEVVGNRRSPLVPPHDSEVGHTYQILEDPRRAGEDATIVSKNVTYPPIPPHQRHSLEDMNKSCEDALVSKPPSIPPRDNYVSEQGHMYQILEDIRTKNGADNEEGGERAPPIPPPFRVLDLSDDQNLDGHKPGRSVYHTLDYNANGGKNTPEQSAYDVIDRNIKKSFSASRSSLDNELAYDVMERSTEEKPINGTIRPPRSSESGYSRIERNMSTVNSNSSVTDRRKISNGQLGPSPVFSILDRDISSSQEVAADCCSSPPPSYDTIDVSGITQLRTCQCDENSPFYHSLDLKVNREVHSVHENHNENHNPL